MSYQPPPGPPPAHTSWRVEHPTPAPPTYHSPQTGYDARDVDGVRYDGSYQGGPGSPDEEYYTSPPAAAPPYPNSAMGTFYTGWPPVPSSDASCTGQVLPHVYYDPYYRPGHSSGAVYPPYHIGMSHPASYGSEGYAYANPTSHPAEMQYPTSSPLNLVNGTPAFTAANESLPVKQSEGGHDPAAQGGWSPSANLTPFDNESYDCAPAYLFFGRRADEWIQAAGGCAREPVLIPKTEYEPAGLPPPTYAYADGGRQAPSPIEQKPTLFEADHRVSAASSSLAGAFSPPLWLDIDRARDRDVSVPLPSPSTYDDLDSPHTGDYTFIVTMGAPGDAAVNVDGVPEDEDAAAVYAKLGRRRRPSVKRSPRKEPFLACFFCRRRKIACHAPDPKKKDQTCDQCARRHLTCEYPTISRRGQRKPGPRKTRPEIPFVPHITRHCNSQGPSGSSA